MHIHILHYVQLILDRHLWLACALTCRNWFDIVAPRLFRTIVIRGIDELPRIAAAIQDKRSPLHFARGVDLQDVPRQPIDKLHVYLDQLFRFWPYLEEFQFTLSRNILETSQSLVAAKSSYRQYSRFTLLSTLSLQQYSFHSFIDLVRICGSLHALQALHLQHVQWKNTPCNMPRLPVGLHHRLKSVSFEECSAPGLLLWLWVCYSENGGQNLCLGKDIILAGGLIRHVYRSHPSSEPAQGLSWKCMSSSDSVQRTGESYLFHLR